MQQASFLYGSWKGTQLVKTSAVQVAHLEEDSADKEESAKIHDPDGSKGWQRSL